MPVPPSVIATPKAMSAISALRSASSAWAVVGLSSKSLLAASAFMPKIEPTTAPAVAMPSVTYAGTMLRFSATGGGGGGAGGGAATTAAAATGGGALAASSM